MHVIGTSGLAFQHDMASDDNNNGQLLKIFYQGEELYDFLDLAVRLNW